MVAEGRTKARKERHKHRSQEKAAASDDVEFGHSVATQHSNGNESHTEHSSAKRKRSKHIEPLDELDGDRDSTEPLSKKSKRKNSVDELEIDISLPEPPSKKSRRREKKAKGVQKGQTGSSTDSKEGPRVQGTTGESTAAAGLVSPANDSSKTDADRSAAQQTSKRSEHGIWIGNLAFSVTRDSLKEFLGREGQIDEEDVLRIHLPPPAKAIKEQNIKAQNKGFAYVDFSSKDVLQKALALSEKLLVGRKVLIKDAKSFEGRPEKAKEPATTTAKPATKKVFVGNLGFDVTKEELKEHFAPAGEVEDIFMATFEDSGKCKGFGWVRFATVEAAEAVVKGFVYRHRSEEDEELDEPEGITDATDAIESKPRKKQKVILNRMNGRLLRCEFAEDAQVRYKKRYGKDAKRPQQSESTAPIEEDPTERPRASRADKEQRRDDRRKRHDARTVAPGMALANAPRASGAIVEGVGKKISFD